MTAEGRGPPLPRRGSVGDVNVSGGGAPERRGSLVGMAERRGSVNVKDVIRQSMHEKRDKKIGALEDHHPLRRIAFSATEEVVIYRGRFSWFSALMMCFFVLTAFASLVLMVLSFRNAVVQMVSEEVSYIDAPNPPWDGGELGPVRQPGDAQGRRIGRRFRFAMPQFTLFYTCFSTSFSLFTVAYFCSELLVQDLGVLRVKNMGDVINRGVGVFLYYTLPIIAVIMSVAACTVYFLSGLNFVISMLVGASMCMCCTHLGTKMNFEGGPRLAHALNYDIVGSLQLAVRTGAIGGLSAHALAQVGVALVWMLLGDAAALLGFGLGVSVVSFYSRIGGGVFSKGSDIGSDYVSACADDYNTESYEALRAAAHLEDVDNDGDVDENYVARQRVVDPNAQLNEEALGFITQREAELRASIEKQMEKTLEGMHPVNYLDAIGENIMDVGGTSSDLFETMCITLATAVILGAKAHEAPHFGTSLPFVVISTGTLGCTAASYRVWAHASHETWRIRRHMQLNLLLVMALVEGVVALYCYLHWRVYHQISEEHAVSCCAVIALGLAAPELCASVCEFFTSLNCPPVRRLAEDADLGPIQVVLQGLGVGFLSAGVPSMVNIAVQIAAFRLEGFYGLVLLACASQACTGWQATLASYGAVANNANRMVHLTTVNEIAHHRANCCAVIGTQMSHNGKCVAGQNAFFATTALLGALMAEKRSASGGDFRSSQGQELAEFSRAGLLASVVFAMLFLAHTLTACIKMAKLLVAHCKDNPKVMPRADRAFPATHIVPLKALVAYCAIESFKLTFAPMCQTFAAPLVIGQLFGFKGLMMLVTGGNSVCFSLNMFLINTGQAWDAARKYILFGMLRNAQGELVGPESEIYDTLGIGEQIGGPLEDLAGPALNNFIKFVVVVSFATSGLYDETPEETWPWGIAQVFINFSLTAFFRCGLAWSIEQIDAFVQRRREVLEQEEGTQMLREIEERERKIEERMQQEAHKLEQVPALIF